MPNKKKSRKTTLYTMSMITSIYGVKSSMIRKLLPPPVKVVSNHAGSTAFWTHEQVSDLLNIPAVQEYRHEQKLLKNDDAVVNYLRSFDLEELYARSELLERHFILHIGPTNSGKTYQSIQALKETAAGTYLAPLRLLALEIFDTLNMEGIPCDLLTGEEQIDVPFARIVSSTVEMANYERHYDVAVIDEAQMIADPDRGDRWLKAILTLDASEMHLCFAPEAQEIITGLLDRIHAAYTVVTHERMAPLRYEGHLESLNEVEPGDALIVFSRRSVLAMAGELKLRGIDPSVIYGALPPVSRREEVHRFTSGRTRVVVATDAIGMGVSLPIRRIIFCEDSKFDGQKRRPLRYGEIRQIAGRAGRYGMYDLGQVLTLTDGDLIRNAMRPNALPEQLTRMTVPFPEAALNSDYPLNVLFAAWERIPPMKGISRASMKDPLLLYDVIKPWKKQFGRSTLYKLLCCPVDTSSFSLMIYWRDCCLALLKKRPLPEPPFDMDSLEQCEQLYKALDIRHQLQQRMGLPTDDMSFRNEVAARINELLLENLKDYAGTFCRICGKKISPCLGSSVCDKCYALSDRYAFRTPKSSSHRR